MDVSDDSTRLVFPPEFIWGAGTSAYQIEGAADEGGRSPSIWDTFCDQPGNVVDGDTGKTACNHYHCFRDDVKLMQQLGLSAYRFSISWSRIIPDGTGTINDTGLAFYESLVDALLDANIEPWITLYHWDLPQYLQDVGGWLNPQTSNKFADYTRAVVRRLSDRVRHWITINEPQCFLKFGLGDGINAPGLNLGLQDQLLAAHHVLLAHGKAVRVIRELASSTPRIGWAPVGLVAVPNSCSGDNIDAARSATMDITAPDLWNNTWFSDPVFLGHYPESGLQVYGSAVPVYDRREMELIAQPLDFLGLNVYTGKRVAATEAGQWEEVPLAEGHARTAFDWPVVDDCLYWSARFHHERYSIPIVITENGMANVDWIDQNGTVGDPQRIDYLHRHLQGLQQCVEEGCDVRGYFHWSLLDNFEWAHGYGRRFGLVYVDFPSGRRVLKNSAHWYRENILNCRHVVSQSN